MLLEVWLGVVAILVAAGSFIAIYVVVLDHTHRWVAIVAGIGAALAAATPYAVFAALVNLGRQIADSTRRLERAN